MIVKVADLSEVVRQARFRESADPLNEVLAQSGANSDGRFDGDLDVDAELYRSGSDVYFQGVVAGTVRGECRRCLDDSSWPLRRSFQFLLLKEGEADDPEDDTGLGHYAGDEIDLGPLVREQALLALVDIGLCSEDCQGLCSGCGANRNRNECSCRH